MNLMIRAASGLLVSHIISTHWRSHDEATYASKKRRAHSFLSLKRHGDRRVPFVPAVTDNEMDDVDVDGRSRRAGGRARSEDP